MRLTVSEPDYADRLCGYLGSVGFPAVRSGPGELEVLLASDLDSDGGDAADALRPFLRVWQRLYPDVSVRVETRV